MGPGKGLNNSEKRKAEVSPLATDFILSVAERRLHLKSRLWDREACIMEAKREAALTVDFIPLAFYRSRWRADIMASSRSRIWRFMGPSSPSMWS